MTGVTRFPMPMMNATRLLRRPKSKLNQRRGSVVPQSRHLRNALSSICWTERTCAYRILFGRRKSPYLRIVRLSSAHAIRPSSYTIVGVPRELNYGTGRSQDHTSELQSHHEIVCRLLV